MDSMNYQPAAIRYPVLHRAKVPFHPDIQAPSGFRQRAPKITALDMGLDRYFLSDEDYFSLTNEAFAQNIHSSTALEGNPLGLDQVRRTSRKYLKGKLTEVPVEAPYQEIVNHLLVWLSPERFRLPWSQDGINHLHKDLMSHDPDSRPGRFRNHDELVIMTDQGQETFKPCPHRHVEREIRSLLDWVNKSGPALHPVVAATVFFHEFESIHPFEDGNGRLGRTLFHIYLQQNGLSNANRCIMEPEILGDRELYYGLLAWTDQENDYAPVLDHFSRSVLTAYEKADAWHRERDLLSHDLGETATQLIKYARRHKEPFTVQQATRWVQARSEQTVRKHLNDLVDLRALESYGKTVAKRYRVADPFRQLENQKNSA